jgi:hypothetical protein
MHGRVNRPAHTCMTMEIPTSNKHRTSRWKNQSGVLLSEGRFLIVMFYLLSLHEIMFYFIFVHNYIWILDKAFNIDFCLLISYTYYCFLRIHVWPWKFPLQTNIVRHDEKTNRAIAIDHVTLNMYKHPIKSCLTRTPPEFKFYVLRKEIKSFFF